MELCMCMCSACVSASILSTKQTERKLFSNRVLMRPTTSFDNSLTMTKLLLKESVSVIEV